MRLIMDAVRKEMAECNERLQDGRLPYERLSEEEESDLKDEGVATAKWYQETVQEAEDALKTMNDTRGSLAWARLTYLMKGRKEDAVQVVRLAENYDEAGTAAQRSIIGLIGTMQDWLRASSKGVEWLRRTAEAKGRGKWNWRWTK